MSERVLPLLLDARRARKQGPKAIAQRQRARLAEMVAYARAHSAYYRELYRNVPERVEDPTLLPVTNKKQLMARFNDWLTDREVTIEKVHALVSDPERIGERFLGRYTVVTTSGTTGTPGIFVQDERSMAVTKVLAALMMRAWLDVGDIVRIIAGRGRVAMVIATGGHFATTVAATRLRRSSRWRAASVQVFPVYMPTPEMVEKLNQFQPAMVAAYASVARLLAGEQEAGRLQIKHVNSDWLAFEPVDADYRPVPAGTRSHTVLLSNLANRLQPVLRYDLGDSILARPDPCPCGDPLPAVRVQGRAADVLTFAAERGGQVTIAPLVFATLVERVPGVGLFQIVQTTPTHLRVRLGPAAGADPDRVWQPVHAAITDLLAEHRPGHVTVERAEEPPEQSAGGKYRCRVAANRGVLHGCQPPAQLVHSAVHQEIRRVVFGATWCRHHEPRQDPHR